MLMRAKHVLGIASALILQHMPTQLEHTAQVFGEVCERRVDIVQYSCGGRRDGLRILQDGNSKQENARF